MNSAIPELAAKLKSGEITARGLALRYISRIEKLNPVLTAYVSTTFGYALECADRADEMLRSGGGTLLTGIPMALKDNICTQGIHTTCCSNMLRGFVPPYSATAWLKLQAQGAVLLGKTNMDEFAMGSASETSCFGAPKNPCNLSMAAGGSSGGSAAAVAADLAVYALGSDTGGSVRQPAAFCGVVGFRPTYGAVSRYGLVAHASSLDQIGPIARTAEDAAIVYDAIRGSDGRDMTCLPAHGEALPKTDISSLVVGIPNELLSDGVEEEVKSAVLRAADIFAAEGAQVKYVSLPSIKSALAAYYIISCAEASSNLSRYDGIRYGLRAEGSSAAESVVKSRTRGFGKEVKRRIIFGSYVLSKGCSERLYQRACGVRAAVSKEFANVFRRCNILLSPTAPTAAFPLGNIPASSVRAYLSDICTVPASIAGIPAASVPCAVTSQGLPAGLQIMGAGGADGLVLSCAEFIGERLEVSAPLCAQVEEV